MKSIRWTKYTKQDLAKEALKYKTRSEFQKKSKSIYQTAFNRKLLNQICSHMPKHVDQSGENHPQFRWSLEKLQQEALKYKTRGEFKKKSPNAVRAARETGVFDKICSHMPRDVKIGGVPCNFKWTLEKLQQEALKYTTRGEFQKNNNGAYQAALKKKKLDLICKHMPAGGSSFAELNLFSIIKNIYPKTQKLVDRKVKIENKSHIKRFDIDIYIPELRKGIEFDGKYHHSFQGLKRGRPNWSDEDLLNYHKIKDSWFASKGIELLHIKEEDWLKDRQSCVDKCLEFLNISLEKAA